MRSKAPLVAIVILPIIFGCSSEEHETGHAVGLESHQGLPTPSEPDPTVAGPAPAPAEPEPGLDPVPSPEVEPELSERKTALANVGKVAFDALKAGEFARLRELTPLDDQSPIRVACPDVPLGDARELEAKFDYCHRQIDWDAIAEAQVFAPKSTGEQAEGCQEHIEDFGRLQLYLRMNDETIWRVDFYGAVGAEGKAMGIDGSLSCKKVDEVPPL